MLIVHGDVNIRVYKESGENKRGKKGREGKGRGEECRKGKGSGGDIVLTNSIGVQGRMDARVYAITCK